MKACHSFLCCLLSLLLCSCMSQRLASESGLYDVALEHTYKLPVDGYWLWDKGNTYAKQKRGSMYVAPLDVSLVQDDYPELAPLIVKQMHGLLMEKMGRSLQETNAANATQWTLTDDSARADIRIDLAVVHLRTQKPALNIIGRIIGHFTPKVVGDAIKHVAKGDITLEGTIRDARSGELIMAFKDSNGAPLRFYHKDSYRRTGNVDANLRHWAAGLAKLCRDGAHDRLGNLTLKEKIERHNFGDAVKARLNDE